MSTKTTTKPKETTKLVFQVRPALDIAETLKFKILSDKKVNFSRKRAFDYLELDTFQGERPVNERHVQFLYNAWVGGRFMWDHVILAQCECEGKRYRINGQHTCWMRVNLNEDYFIKKGEEPQVREVVYCVADEAQMRGLYSTFDQNKSRTPSHVFRALLQGTQEVADLWPSTLNVLSAGLKHWLFEKDKHLASANDMAALVSDKHEHLFKIVGLFFQAHYSVPTRFLRRSAVLAAQFATFDVAGGKAAEFWEAVATGLNLTDKTDARYALRTYLQTHAESLKAKGEIVSAEDTYRVCVSAWNKWRKSAKVAQGLRPTETRQKAI